MQFFNGSKTFAATTGTVTYGNDAGDGLPGQPDATARPALTQPGRLTPRVLSGVRRPQRRARFGQHGPTWPVTELWPDCDFY